MTEHTKNPKLASLKKKPRLVLLIALGLTVSAAWATMTFSAHSSEPQAKLGERVQASPSPQWSPIGSVWNLTVDFLTGSKAGQSETSLMTFLPDGQLTATFPGATPATPETRPPAMDGHWSMTGARTFHYEFKDPIMVNTTMVAYVATSINAYLTSASTYVAGGVGVAYAVATGQPLAGQYNVTQTVARVSQEAGLVEGQHLL